MPVSPVDPQIATSSQENDATKNNFHFFVRPPRESEPDNFKQNADTAPVTCVQRFSLCCPAWRPEKQRPTSYQGFNTDKSLTKAFINALKMSWFHVVRTNEAFLIPTEGPAGEAGDIASKAEKDLLTYLYPPRDAKLNLMKCKQISNYIVWRRSALLVLLPLMSLFTVLAAWDAVPAAKALYRYRDLAEHAPSSFDEVFAEEVKLQPLALEWSVDTSIPLKQRIDALLYNSTKTFSQILADASRDLNVVKVWLKKYAIQVIKGVWYRIMEQSSVLQFTRVVFTVVILSITVGLIGSSLYYWPHWKKSNRFLRLAWFFSIVTPFVAAAIPIQLILDWDPIEKDLNRFMKDSVDLFAGLVDGRFAQVDVLINQMGPFLDSTSTVPKTVCEEDVPDIKASLAIITDIFSFVCKVANSAEKMPLIGHQFETVSDFCVNTWGENRDSLQNTLESIYKFCNAGNDVGVREKMKEFHKLLLESKDGLHSSFKQSIATAHRYDDTVVVFVKHASNTLMGILNAVLGSGPMWAIVIALAPGLLNGSVTTKAIVPESAVPGIFVVIMPWFYTPIVWTLYSMISHLVGNWAICIGFLLLAMYPMAFSILGSYYKLSLPMNQATFVVVIKKIRAVKNALIVMGLVFLGLGLHWMHLDLKKDYEIYFESQQGNDESTLQIIFQKTFSDTLFEIVFNPISIASFVCSFIAKMCLTAIVGGDYMLQVTAEQRAVETSGMIGAARIGSSESKAFAEVKRDAENRERYLDLLVYVLSASPKRVQPEASPISI